MSANLLDGLTLTLWGGTTESDGTWHHAARTEAGGHQDWLKWDLPDQAALETDQTYHVGLSVRGASVNATSLHMTIGSKDAAGKKGWYDSPALAIGTSWGRVEGAIVVPSGMRPFCLYVAASGTCPETWMTAPTLSLGSPVPLASSAHTPYATQDHVMVTYATQASLKVTDDSIKAEVEERGKLAGRVGTLESTSSTHTSKLEQLATSIKSLVKGESTYTDPDGKSATSGIYSLVTQTRDSVTALFGQYTKTEDLAATDAVKDAKKAGTDAQAAASAAQTTADSAKSTAQTAASDAATAKTTATSAANTASNASKTAQDAKKTADGISVGGRNIARGTATLTNDVQVGKHPRGLGTCDYLGGIKSMGVSTAWSGIYFRLKDMADAGRIKAGQQYTASVYVMSETDLTTTFSYHRFTSSSNKPTVDELTGSSYEVVDLKAGEWHQLKCTFTATSGDDSTLTSNRARIENSLNVEVWYAGPKLDSGNRATDYSPAPEDVDAAIGTAQDTANAANDTANAAKGTADSLATMIREDATGITVGKSADGQTWSTGRTHMDEDSFDVLDKAGNVLSSFGEKIIELGKNSQDAVISMLGGLVTIKATSAGVSDGAWCEISTDKLSTNGYHASRIAAGYKDETGFTPKGTAEVMANGGEGDGNVLLYAGAYDSDGNTFAMSPAAYTLNHPEYLLSALLGGNDGGSGVPVTSDLDTCGPGVFTYNTSTESRPTDYGTCVCIRAGGGDWLFEFALPTVGDPHWRRNINGAGWSSWWVITSQ